MQEEIKITQSTAALDLFRASNFLAVRHRQIRFFLFLVPSIIVISSIASIALSEKEERHMGILSLLISLMGVIVFYYSVTLIISLLLVKLKANHFRNITFTFNNWGMIKEGKGIEFTRQWERFVKWNETKSFILLYVSDNDAHIILKRAMSSGDLEKLTRLIETRLRLFPA